MSPCGWPNLLLYEAYHSCSPLSIDDFIKVVQYCSIGESRPAAQQRSEEKMAGNSALGHGAKAKEGKEL